MNATAPNAIIRPDHVDIGVTELQDMGFLAAGKIRTHDGVGRAPLECSCVPHCGGRYFPGVRVPSELHWSDVKALLVRAYGLKNFQEWADETERRKRDHVKRLREFAHFQGSDPWIPTMMGIPDIVDIALTHDFPGWFQGGRDSTKAERFDSLKAALWPLVVDKGASQ